MSDHSGQDARSGGDSVVKIALVDDHRLFLNGFSLLLERLEGEFLVAPFDTPVDLIAALKAGGEYDLVICDLVMSSMNGLAFVDAIRGKHAVPVLMLSGIESSPPIAEMKHLGVKGFVHKSADDDSLADAIRTVLAGESYYPDGEDGDHGDAPPAFGAAETWDDNGGIPVLTPRQIEVLRLISDGASNQDISRELGISGNTVKAHLRQIFELLRVNKRTACVRAARSLGLL